MFKFLTEHWVDAFFVFMILVSLLTGNKTLLYAMGIVFVLRMVRAAAVLEILAGKGISWGILVITIGFLAPIALDRYDLSQFKAVFTSPVGWIAILCGIAVAIMGGKGVIVGQTDMVITVGIILGTFLGVAVFKGNPVGPLIGSGMAWFIIALVRRIIPF